MVAKFIAVNSQSINKYQMLATPLNDLLYLSFFFKRVLGMFISQEDIEDVIKKLNKRKCSK